MTEPTKYVPSEDSDKPGNPPSLIRVFGVRLKKVCVLSFHKVQSKHSDQLHRCPGCSCIDHCVGFIVLWLIFHIPSLKVPILYSVGIFITNANISSIKVLRALYVNILQGR